MPFNLFSGCKKLSRCSIRIEPEEESKKFTAGSSLSKKTKDEHK